MFMSFRSDVVDAALDAGLDATEFMSFVDDAPRCPDCGSYCLRPVYGIPNGSKTSRQIATLCDGCGEEVR